MGYNEKEQAVVNHIYSKFEAAGKMDHPNQVVSSTIDKVFKQIVGEGKKYGCLLDFGGGARRNVEPFKKEIWAWSIIGVIMIRFMGDTDTVEEDLREVIEVLQTLFTEDHTLNNVTPWVRIDRIDQAEIMELNDVPLYWLPFQITIVEGPDF